jgi:arsenate reductase
MLSNTFAGIAPSSVPSFIVAQLIGGALAVVVIRTLYPNVTPAEAAEVMVPHGRERSSADGSIGEPARSR